MVSIQCVDLSLKGVLEVDPYDNYTIPDYSITEANSLIATEYSSFTNTLPTTFSINSVTHTIDRLKIELNGNSFIENFGGRGHGIVDIQGAIRLNFENDLFEKNGENCNETYDFYRRVVGKTDGIGPALSAFEEEYSL